MKGSEAICEVLEKTGMKYVFGIPGGAVRYVFDALYNYKSRINCNLIRHEQVASVMAEVVGRITGKPGVFMAQGPFAGSTGGFGIMTAYLASSPMVVITDFSERTRFAQLGEFQVGTGDYGGYDLLQICKSMCKYTTEATTPVEAFRGLLLAHKHATTGRPGPTCLLLREPAVLGEFEEELAVPSSVIQGLVGSAIPRLHADDAYKIASLLLQAKSPVIIAGNGAHVSHCYDGIRKLAEEWGVPVATSFLGKSVLPENHDWSLGAMGTFGQQTANKWVSGADVILVLGCRLSPTEMCRCSTKFVDPKRQAIIQIDIEPRNIGWVYPVAVSGVSDIGSAVEEILKAGNQIRINDLNSRRAKRLSILSELKKENHFFYSPRMEVQTQPVPPQQVPKALQNVLTSQDLVLCDAGNNRFWMGYYFQCQGPGTFLAPGALAGMGWAVPAAVAAKLILKEREVVAVCGDGGMSMSLPALLTAFDLNLPVKIIVMNDSLLGMVRQQQDKRVICSEFRPTDFASICKAMGGEGITILHSNELEEGLREAVRCDVPTVVDIKINTEDSIFKELLSPMAKEE